MNQEFIPLKSVLNSVHTLKVMYSTILPAVRRMPRLANLDCDCDKRHLKQFLFTIIYFLANIFALRNALTDRLISRLGTRQLTQSRYWRLSQLALNHCVWFYIIVDVILPVKEFLCSYDHPTFWVFCCVTRGSTVH